MISPEHSNWFAVQVVPQHEHKVATQLRYKGQEEFLPLTAAHHQWSDRRKLVSRPLFPGYVFCRAKRSSFGTILSTPGVHKIVSFGGTAYPIPEIEIQSLQQALGSGREVCVTAHLTVGQRVQVSRGPLSGITGIVMRQKNRERLVISVELIMKSVSVEIAPSELIPLSA